MQDGVAALPVTTSASRSAKRRARADLPPGVTFCVLVVIGRFEGADGLAHEREVAGERTDGEDERLIGVVPWSLRMAVFAEQQGRKSAAAGNGVSPVQGYHVAATGVEVNQQDSKVVPDHESTSVFCRILRFPTSLISRQS